MEKKASSWFEIRPLSTGRFEAGNFKHVLNVLYKNGKPFRFFMANSQSSVEGRRAVKFFLELEGKDIADYLARYIRATMDVEVVEAKPQTEVHPELVEFEMKNDYALPICELGEKPQENPVDKIVTALSVDETGAFEVMAVADPKASRSIKNYRSRITGERESLGQIAADITVGILGAIVDAIIGKPPPKPSKKEGERKPDPTVKAKADAAEKKLNRNLFTCTLKACGRRETLSRITEALPCALNEFEKSRVLKLVGAPSKLTRPCRFNFQNALSNLCWITPLLLIVLAMCFGLLNPLRLDTSDILMTIAAMLSGIPFYVMFKKRKPIVLSDEELSLIVGLPTAFKRLPVEPGSTVHTRGYLPTTG
ncbi:MAG: hypothetical protein QXZ25_06570 [Candidatus Bathyarchaeia archaeon]